MPVQPVIDKLATLKKYLDGLSERASVDTLNDRLTHLDITLEDVSDYVRFGEKYYSRNLVCEGKWYHLLVICWRSGQRSPIHNHAGSTCGFRVLTGVATETRFELSPNKSIKPVSTRDMHTGELSVAQDREIHQVSNLQTEDTDLVTLHIYSPALLRMDTYSLTDRIVRDFRPMVLEYAGSGI